MVCRQNLKSHILCQLQVKIELFWSDMWVVLQKSLMWIITASVYQNKLFFDILASRFYLSQVRKYSKSSIFGCEAHLVAIQSLRNVGDTTQETSFFLIIDKTCTKTNLVWVATDFCAQFIQYWNLLLPAGIIWELSGEMFVKCKSMTSFYMN